MKNKNNDRAYILDEKGNLATYNIIVDKNRLKSIKEGVLSVQDKGKIQTAILTYDDAEDLKYGRSRPSLLRRLGVNYGKKFEFISTNVIEMDKLQNIDWDTDCFYDVEYYCYEKHPLVEVYDDLNNDTFCSNQVINKLDKYIYSSNIKEMFVARSICGALRFEKTGMIVFFEGLQSKLLFHLDYKCSFSHIAKTPATLANFTSTTSQFNKVLKKTCVR